MPQGSSQGSCLRYLCIISLGAVKRVAGSSGRTLSVGGLSPPPAGIGQNPLSIDVKERREREEVGGECYQMDFEGFPEASRCLALR